MLGKLSIIMGGSSTYYYVLPADLPRLHIGTEVHYSI